MHLVFNCVTQCNTFVIKIVLSVGVRYVPVITITETSKATHAPEWVKGLSVMMCVKVKKPSSTVLSFILHDRRWYVVRTQRHSGRFH